MSSSSAPYASPLGAYGLPETRRADLPGGKQIRQDLLAAEAMPPIAEAMPPGKLFFSPKGRISRRGFWGGMLGLAALGIVLGALLNIAGFHGERVEGLVNLLLAWPAFAVSAKRWHDRDRSAWWVLVALIPVVGFLWLLVVNGLLPGMKGDNRFGPPPHEGRLSTG
ncbi:DUF805 domain-containing protein [Ideonella azotifigens]|uniref:DUF805 domain-containing protein n=1 Tax=Ideonella azotifigens TaxID=513160 RepID=A0ABN1K1J8_9BURK|nr:DUF805 domain-containing protein [Ideonella azotifigens]MCD2341726.1 DUF805 domain-containing protein [Ideonella azotifigens]